MRIPDTFIQELISRADCVEVVRKHVELKKAGANYMGLCPFHGEKSPSFTVSPTKQFYHCFGCGKSGNAVGFLMDHLGLSFVEAVRDLAGQMGMAVPQEQLSPQEEARTKHARETQKSLTELMAQAAQAYQLQLRALERGQAYFKRRGVSGEVAKRFGLGYAPEGRSNLAGVFPNYLDPKLVECGLVIERVDEHSKETRRYDRFRDRVMFPIRNVKGETIGFGGRILDQGEPKYLNSPETPLFSKGRELYGLWEGKDAIRKAGYVLVTEGYMDVVALAQWGFEQAVATLGTACTPDHVHKLFRFTDSVVFSFDGDKAGRRAARKALDGSLAYATDTRSVKFLFLPQEHDPDSFIRELGAEAFGHAVQQATPLSRFLIDSARDGCEMDTAEGRAQMLAASKPLWALLPEGALRIQLLNELAALAQMSVASLKDMWGLNAPAAAPALKRYQEYSGTPNKYGDRGANSPKTTRFGASTQASGGSGGVARGRPPTREERLVQLALLNHALLGDLSEAQHALLAQLAAPQGSLLAWLEGQLHNMGAQPWAALREGLRAEHGESAMETLAVRLMRAEALAGSDSHEEANTDQAEFADILRRIQIDALKAQESAALQSVASDKGAMQRYRDLHTQRRALETVTASPTRGA